MLGYRFTMVALAVAALMGGGALAAVSQKNAPEGQAAQVPRPGSPDEPASIIMARQAAMLEMERAADLIAAMVDDGVPWSREEAARAAENLVALLSAMPEDYPEETFAEPSLALPTVRSEWADFTALASEAAATAGDLRAAVEQENLRAVRTSLAELRHICSTCHLRYSPGIRTDEEPLPSTVH